MAGLALALSTTFNPLIGGLFSLIYGVGDSRRRGSHAAAQTGAPSRDCRRTRRSWPSGWCIGNDMVEGAAGVVLFGLGGYARNQAGRDA